jgi:hypothetical protein
VAGYISPPSLPRSVEPGTVGVDPFGADWAFACPLEGRHVDPVGATLAPAQTDDLVRCTGPVESSDLDLFPDDERRERARDAILEHGEEGSVLFIFAVRVDESLIDEASEAQ